MYIMISMVGFSLQYANEKGHKKYSTYEYERLGTYRTRVSHNTICVVKLVRPVRTEALIFMYHTHGERLDKDDNTSV